MPPRLNFYGVRRSIAIHTRPSIVSRQPRILQIESRRGFANEKESQKPTLNNGSGLGHASEEAADIGKIIGETTPDLDKGTPVQEVYLS